jgi:hypothetical protein
MRQSSLASGQPGRGGGGGGRKAGPAPRPLALVPRARVRCPPRRRRKCGNIRALAGKGAPSTLPRRSTSPPAPPREDARPAEPRRGHPAGSLPPFRSPAPTERIPPAGADSPAAPAATTAGGARNTGSPEFEALTASKRNQDGRSCQRPALGPSAWQIGLDAASWGFRPRRLEPARPAPPRLRASRYTTGPPLSIPPATPR